jgi:hypothetical protein
MPDRCEPFRCFRADGDGSDVLLRVWMFARHG